MMHRSPPFSELFVSTWAAVLCVLWSVPTHAGVLENLFAPKAELWDRWTVHADGATENIDHSAWERFLGNYLSPSSDGINRLAYGRVTEADRESLRDYLSRLQAVPISEYARREQLAYWINLYNALTVSVVLDHYPVESIRDIDISPGFFADGPWDKRLVKLEGEQLSLNDIEHRILRPIWRDPRIHYAVNCASTGCPNLQPVAFTADNTEALLEKGASEYVNSPRGARFEEDGRLFVSSIYVWFGEDFGGGELGVIEHLKRHAQPDLKERLAGSGGIDGDRYDWTINDVDGRDRP